MYFTDEYGLTGIHDPKSENGQVFLVDYHLQFHRISGFRVGIERFEKQLELSYTGVKGLYHRNPELIDRRIMSHDNLSAIMAGSYFYGTDHRYDIWKYLLTHFGTYDNSQGKTDQFTKYLPFNPANFFIWGLCANSILAYLFLPFFLINFFITLNKKQQDTSGKILLFIELYPLRRNFIVRQLYKLYERSMIKMYGNEYHKALRQIYHAREGANFPLVKLFE